MIQFSRWKVIFVLMVCFLGIAYAMPNVVGPKGQAWIAENMPSWAPSNTVNLGLDLRGGSHILLDVDLDTVYKDNASNLMDSFRLALREQKIGYTSIRMGAEYNISITLRDPDRDGENARKAIRKLDALLVVEESEEGGVILVSQSDGSKFQLRDQAISQSIEIIRRRIDETGTKEPAIQRQGESRILVQLPGVDNPARIKELLGKTAKLGFHMVDERATNTQRPRPGAKLLPMQENPEQKMGVKKRAVITGDMLQTAQPAFQEGSPVVSFRFNTLGAKRFCDISRKNVGRPFAIVLDDEVISAPVIREAICGGSGQISGGFTVEEANDLALLLRAGALPAPLAIAEERTVGPSLGADSVEAGKNASILAMIAVVIFMAASYGLFGFFACVALMVNVCLIFAMLSGLQATLTLPGIAGIVLTIGMAVDANVLVFERIREEFKSGRSLMSAIDAGYARAMSTILDANITTLIAATLLYSFGTGPIKGFSVTLAIGILTSLFTSIMVTRLMVVKWLLGGRTRRTELPLA